MSDVVEEQAIRFAAGEMFPGRTWNDLSEAEQAEAREQTQELLRILSDPPPRKAANDN